MVLKQYISYETKIKKLVFIKRTSAQSVYSRLRLHVSTRGWSYSGPYNFLYQMLCPLWGPIVFTVVEYVLHSEQKQWQKRQHLREGNHIHGIEQDQPRGMKSREQNNELQVSLPNN